MNELEEYQKLKTKFPRVCTVQIGNDNCDWTDHVFNSVNCYWCFDGVGMHECLYDFGGLNETGAIDTLWNSTCEYCYETNDSLECNNCSFSQYVYQCYNLEYCSNCGSCHDCFGCTNLMNRSYCIFNIQYTEDEYTQKVKELKKQPPAEMLKQLYELELKFPKIQSFFNDNVNSDYVDYVYRSTNSYYCFDSQQLEDCGFVTNSNECKDSWASLFSVKLEHCAETTDSNECYNCYEAQDCNRCFDSSYLYSCDDSNNCFMCSNLANAKYCILNVQYTKEEYEKKVAEIKNSLGLKFVEKVN